MSKPRPDSWKQDSWPSLPTEFMGGEYDGDKWPEELLVEKWERNSRGERRIHSEMRYVRRATDQT